MSETPSDLQVCDNPEQRRFEIDLGDGTIAIAEYELLPDRIVFTHTEVPPKHEGHGIGSTLIRSALRSARERGLKVIPVCPFFAEYMRKHVEEQDLLTGSWREKLGLPDRPAV
jgi:predicted GNAT family acetyltransferase